MSADARVSDVAYSRYDGPRAGRAAAIWSLARWSSLRALGARRGWKAKLIPITLILLGFAPGIVVLGLRAIFGPTVFRGGLANALPYANYAGIISIVILVFSVVVTPELVCPDRRDRTLSLYFSTAISRGDYVAGKVLAALMPILLVTLFPPLILYAGNVLFSVHPLAYVERHWLDILRILGAGLLIGIYYALVGLAVSSLTSRRAFAVGGYLAFLAIPTIIGGVLAHALDERYLRLFAFAVVPLQAARGLYPGYTDEGHISAGLWASTAVELMVVAIAVLAVRYGRDTG
jgi:ABC-2 type transport system permease protein